MNIKKVNMKKNFLVLGMLALALTFAFVACDSSQQVEVTNWADMYSGTAPSFSTQPEVVGSSITFSLTGTSWPAISGSNIPVAYKVDGKNGFYNDTVASVSYNVTDDVYKCTISTTYSNPNSGLFNLVNSDTVRIGISYPTLTGQAYVWSNAFGVTSGTK
jgi:hypothetical protein